MNIEKSMLEQLLITDPPKLDPIRVITEDYSPGAGRITIICYTRAWVGYWGAMSDRSIRQFFCDCDPSYLMGNMSCGLVPSRSKQMRESETSYLIRIIEAVQAALREVLP